MTQETDYMFAAADAEDAADLAAAEREAAATGKEPFSYARLEELLGAEPPEVEELLRLQYYVRYTEMRTLAELADMLRYLARWA